MNDRMVNDKSGNGDTDEVGWSRKYGESGRSRSRRSKWGSCTSNLSSADVTRDNIGAATWGIGIQLPCNEIMRFERVNLPKIQSLAEIAHFEGYPYLTPL